MYDKNILNTSVIWVNGKPTHVLTKKTKKKYNIMLSEKILFHKQQKKKLILIRRKDWNILKIITN